MLTIIVGKQLPVAPVEALMQASGATRYVCVDDFEAVRWIVNDASPACLLIVDAEHASPQQINALPANVNCMVTNAAALQSGEFAAAFIADCNGRSTTDEAA